jgi:(p)ppGpp synthase/HD superfamily hydrolase
MGQKSRRQGAKGTSGGANATKASQHGVLSPLKQPLSNGSATNINNNGNITPSAGWNAKVSKFAGHVN